MQHGFWMKGDFFICITRRNIDSKFGLEMYRYDSKDIIDYQKLFVSNELVSLNVQHDDSRRYASIFVEELNAQTQRIERQTLFLLDSAKFQGSLNDGRLYSIDTGLALVKNVEFPDRSTLNLHHESAYRLFQLFSYNRKTNENELYIIWQHTNKTSATQSRSTAVGAANHIGNLRYDTTLLLTKPA